MLRRAFFVIGSKPILCLFLAFAFNGKASNATFTEFGCEFVDNEYKMKRNSNNTSPIWSEEGIGSNIDLPIDPKDSYWQPIVDYLSKVSIMNDVSQFTQFVKTYKTNHNGAENLESFFNNYNVPFQLNETRGPASYIIQMFHNLKDNHRNQPEKPVLQYYYLVSALIDPSDMDISIALSDNGTDHENKKRDELVRKMLETRVQDHLAGIMKITSGNRTGYILIDPGYHYDDKKRVHPFVVFLMEDGKYPHKEPMHGFNDSYDLIHFTLKKDIKFILAKHKNLNTETQVLYYIGKPYCSFIENTIKANLLRLNHGIIARDPINKKQGCLTFKISRNDNPVLFRNIDNTPGQMTVDYRRMSIDNFIKPLLENTTLPVIQILMVLGISKEEITTIKKELQYIQTEVFKDYTFMSTLINLSKKLNLDKEPKDWTNIGEFSPLNRLQALGNRTTVVFIPVAAPRGNKWKDLFPYNVQKKTFKKNAFT